jgi:hypothetical protein
VRSDGTSDGTYVQGDTFKYDAGVVTGGTITYTGVYEDGSVTDDVTTLTKNGTAQPTSETINNYYWGNTGQEMNIIDYKPDVTKSTSYTTTYNYDGLGNLAQVSIADPAGDASRLSSDSASPRILTSNPALALQRGRECSKRSPVFGDLCIGGLRRSHN